VTHVLLSAFSPMLHSIIVDALSTQRDVTVLTPDAIAGGDDREVNVVLLPASQPDQLDAVKELLWRWPRSRVVAVASTGRDAVLWELAPRKVALGDLCPATLLDIVCGTPR